MGFGLLDRSKQTFIRYLMDERRGEHHHLCDFDRITYEVRPCDVLLIEGTSRVSDIIGNITQSPWTHACIYVGRLHDVSNPIQRQLIREHCDYPPDTQLIIESLLGKGTIVNTLEHYKDMHIRICRPNGISRKDAQQVISFAISRLGVEYGIRHILDLARFMLPWRFFPRKWRSTLFERNPGIPTKEICSSMIAEAFESIKYPILPTVKKHKQKGIKLIRRNHRLFTPRDFDYSPFFEIIKYPIFDLSEDAIYKNFPWEESHPQQ